MMLRPPRGRMTLRNNALRRALRLSASARETVAIGTASHRVSTAATATTTTTTMARPFTSLLRALLPPKVPASTGCHLQPSSTSSQLVTPQLESRCGYRFLSSSNADEHGQVLASLLKDHKVFEQGLYEPSSAGKLFHVFHLLTRSSNVTVGQMIKKTVFEELNEANMIMLDDMYYLVACCEDIEVAQRAKAEACYDKIDVLADGGTNLLDEFNENHFQLAVLDGDDLSSFPSSSLGNVLEELARIVKPGGFVALNATSLSKGISSSNGGGGELVGKLQLVEERDDVAALYKML